MHSDTPVHQAGFSVPFTKVFISSVFDHSPNRDMSANPARVRKKRGQLGSLETKGKNNKKSKNASNFSIHGLINLDEFS